MSQNEMNQDYGRLIRYNKAQVNKTSPAQGEANTPQCQRLDDLDHVLSCFCLVPYFQHHLKM